jgi:DNA mismatch repair protein MutS
MDIHTKRNLELTESMRNKERMFSLLWLLDETKTAMGSRKLKSWLESPLTNKEEIESRYNTVSTLLEEFKFKFTNKNEASKLVNNIFFFIVMLLSF